MKKWNYYNDFDPKICEWARELIRAKLVPDGEVDCRSIIDVQPEDLAGFSQCHFFSGVLGWPLALRLAGIPDDYTLWTGSAPCQPFSAAGKQKGTEDERHLWPEFYRLIQACRPPLIFGEQVASSLIVGPSGKAKLGAGKEAEEAWIDRVFADLEVAHYTCGAGDIPAASVGAPHIRQRLYWVADSNGKQIDATDARGLHAESIGSGIAGGLGDAYRAGSQPGRQAAPANGYGCAVVANGSVEWMEYAESDGREQRRTESGGRGVASGCGVSGMGDAESGEQRWQRESIKGVRRSGEAGGPGAWSNFDLVPCLDGKSRRIEPRTAEVAARISESLVRRGDLGASQIEAIAQEVAETFPLIQGATARVMRLRGYGNALTVPVAAEFIQAFFETINS